MQLMYSTTPADGATRWLSLTSLQRSSRCILQPKPTGPLVDWVLPLCREAVDVFYNPSRRGHSLIESDLSAEKQSMYSTTQADGATRWLSLTSLQRSSRCILQPKPTGPLVDWVWPLCREAVDVFYNPSRLGHSLIESDLSAKKQSVPSTAPADWATRSGSLTLLQRFSRCILQPQPIVITIKFYHFWSSIFQLSNWMLKTLWWLSLHRSNEN